MARHLRPRLLRGADDEREWEYEDPYRFGPVLGQIDEYLIGEGTHHQLWKALGAHVISHQGVRGTHFAVWAPNARRVAVLGEGRVLALGTMDELSRQAHPTVAAYFSNRRGAARA